MGVLDRIAARLGFVRPQRRSFAAAEVSRLTASLAKESEFINTTLRREGRLLRARSRQVAKNNPHAKRFFNMVVDNVCGPEPFRLQAKVKFASGKLDTGANRRIEDAWLSWGRPGQCEITGQWSWNAVQRLLARALAVDGELLLRKFRGPEYGRHGFQLQVIDIDRLDDWKNESLKGGGAIHQGIEVDANGKRVAYYILRRKPSQWGLGYTVRESDRVPADEIVHVFVPEHAEQIRGVPWIYAALLNLVHIGAFEEAAVIAARVGAAQMGIIESPDGGKTLADQMAAQQGGAATADPQIAAEPGTFPMLPPGYKVTAWNPQYPDAAIEPFLKAMLRGVSAGINVAYHNLSGDMEGVNYSSARIAELDERDGWMTIQSFMAEHLHQPVYEAWLTMQVTTQALPFDFARLEKYRNVYWQARRWAWVDPMKEVQAAIAANNHRLKSRTRIVAEGGEDIEDVLDEIALEEQLAADKKVTLDVSPPKPAAPAQPEGDPENETETPDAAGA